MDEKKNETEALAEETTLNPEITEKPMNTKAPTASRKDFQLPRRMFHMGMGVFSGLVYGFLLTHKQAVYILGTTACSLYMLEQVRINYPELAEKIKGLNKYLLRAEEELKESSAIPYAMAILLCILTFPKPIALCAIFTLAISDPLSAIFGIRFGKHKVVEGKSVEGSLAFFISCFIVVLSVFYIFAPMDIKITISLAALAAFVITLFEMVPLRLDDNLTIPLFTAFSLWILCGLMSVPGL